MPFSLSYIRNRRFRKRHVIDIAASARTTGTRIGAIPVKNATSPSHTSSRTATAVVVENVVGAAANDANGARTATDIPDAIPAILPLLILVITFSLINGQ